MRIVHKRMHHIGQLRFIGLHTTLPLILLILLIPLMGPIQLHRLAPVPRRNPQPRLFHRTQPHKMRPRLML